jgi:hypothetical protein
VFAEPTCNERDHVHLLSVHSLRARVHSLSACVFAEPTCNERDHVHLLSVHSLTACVHSLSACVFTEPTCNEKDHVYSVRQCERVLHAQLSHRMHALLLGLARTVYIHRI